MPESRTAIRLKIQLLLRQGDHDGADALLHRALRHRPEDAGLFLLRARSLAAQGRFAEADPLMRRVLAWRPQHVAALRLAGHVALRCGDAHRAAACWRAADLIRPRDGIKCLRVKALLKIHRPDLARGIMEQIQQPPLLLRTEVLIAEGRLKEAAEALASQRPEPDDPEYEPACSALIEVLEHAAGSRALAAELARLGPEHPAAAIRGGLAWLALGSFEEAIRRMARLRGSAGHRASSLSILMVAAAMLGRNRLATRALERLRRLREPVDRQFIAHAWCRGMVGRVIRRQSGRHSAGHVVPRGLLEGLLRDARETFEAARRRGEEPSPPRFPGQAEACPAGLEQQVSRPPARPSGTDRLRAA
jgi:tetratricopeptide (TPR) repeat protein